MTTIGPISTFHALPPQETPQARSDGAADLRVGTYNLGAGNDGARRLPGNGAPSRQ